MMEADEKEKAAPDTSDAAAIDSNFRARYSLEENAQSYSTVTDLARFRG